MNIVSTKVACVYPHCIRLYLHIVSFPYRTICSLKNLVTFHILRYINYIHFDKVFDLTSYFVTTYSKRKLYRLIINFKEQFLYSCSFVFAKII